MTAIQPAWLEGANIIWEVTPAAVRPEAIYVGVEPLGLAAGKNSLAGGGNALVLSHKARGGLQANSAASFLSKAFDDNWISFLDPKSDRPFAGRTVVVEDASPDTCLTLLFLKQKAAGLQLDPKWIAYVDRWENGDTHTTGAPNASFGVLLSALVHSLIDFDRMGNPTSREDRMTCAVEAGCDLITRLFLVGADAMQLPLSVPQDPKLDELLACARAHVDAERDLAHRIAKSGTVIDLALEIRGSRRLRLVDALIMEEKAATGALKSFLRSSDVAPRGNGFPFWALRRPREEAGSDITFSVDPSVGIWLRPQWEALEQAEEAAWNVSGETRPRGMPRPLESFERGQLPPGVKPSNQPWYDGRPLYTLIGAPRQLPPAHGSNVAIPGSKLTWQQALGIVWRTACPLAKFDLRDPTTHDPVDLFLNGASHRKALDVSPAGQQMFLVDLKIGPAADEFVSNWSDTVARCLAAYLAQGRIDVENLPGLSDFKVIRRHNGAVLISHHGVLILQEREASDFPHDQLLAEVETVKRLLTKAERLDGVLQKARDATIDAIASASTKRKWNSFEVLYSILRETLEERAHPRIRSPDPFLAELQGGMEKWWSADQRFQLIIDQAKELRELVETASEIHTSEMVYAISIVGFPFALLVNFFASSFAESGNAMQSNAILKGIFPGPIILWLLFSLLAAIGLWTFVYFRRRRWRADISRYASSASSTDETGGAG